MEWPQFTPPYFVMDERTKNIENCLKERFSPKLTLYEQFIKDKAVINIYIYIIKNLDLAQLKSTTLILTI